MAGEQSTVAELEARVAKPKNMLGLYSNAIDSIGQANSARDALILGRLNQATRTPREMGGAWAKTHFSFAEQGMLIGLQASSPVDTRPGEEFDRARDFFKEFSAPYAIDRNSGDGACVLDKAPIRIADLLALPEGVYSKSVQRNQKVREAMGFDARSMLHMPLLLGGEALGAILFLKRR